MVDRKTLAGTPASLRRRLAGDDRLVAFVRSGDKAAFEALYERHAAELLSFCAYMLGSRQDAEDAVQATFSSAYTALLRDNRPITLRPWLFAIARNDCLSILRRRRPWEELNGEPALGPDPARDLELREELREIVVGVRALPERERAALVLTELHGLSQRETGSVLGVRAEQVKAYVYQARSKLISEREARETDCRQIREELATARGAALLRGRLRRHVRNCEDCRTYAAGVSHQRRQLAALLPIAPTLALRYRALEQALGIGASDPGYTGSAAVGASIAGAAAEVAGGGIKALAVKVAAGIVAVGAGAGVGVSVLSAPSAVEPPAHAATATSQRLLAESAAPGARGRLDVAARVEGGFGEIDGRTMPAAATPKGIRSTGPSVAGAIPDPGGAGAVDTTPAAGEHTSTNTNRTLRSRPADPDPPKTEEQRKALEAERNHSREAQLHSTAERKHERELHGPPGSAKPPRTEAQRESERAERKKAREENPQGRSRAPKSEEERHSNREERLKHREERRASEKEAAEPTP